MVLLPLTFASLTLSLAHEDITVRKANNLSEMEKPAKKANGQSNVWKPLKGNPVVKQAEEETSRAWNGFWNNSWVRNAVNQTEADATYAWKLAENNTVLRPVVQEAENTYSQLTNVTSWNATVPAVEHMETHGWNVGALLCAAILLLCPATCCGLCAWANYEHFSEVDKKAYEELEESSEATSHTDGDISATHLLTFSWCYHLVSRLRNWDDLELGEVLRQEVLLMLVCPFLALLAAPWTTCEQGAPSWIYLIYLPVLARNKWVERQLMTRLDVEWTYSTWLAFSLWGPLDHMDWFTDGSAPVQALACDLNGLQITERWASAWGDSSAGWFVPVVQTFQVSGLTFLAFCLGAAAQQFLGAVGSSRAWDPLRADLCGMLGLAELRGRTGHDPDRSNGTKLLFIALVKVVLENIPQLLLQSSFFALVFDQLTPLGRAKVLFSILLGLASASLKILEGMRELVKEFCRKWAQGSWDGWCFFSIISAFFMLAPAFVLWTVVKLHFVFHCETHLWNFGSGCMEWT